MKLTDAIRMSTEISQQLFTCVSKDEVEGVFCSYKISQVLDKIGLLRLCMGVKNYSPSPSVDKLTSEQQYEDELLLFLDSSWRFLA